MSKKENDGDFYCEKCGKEFKHMGMNPAPWKKVGLYICSKCGHDVQIAKNPASGTVLSYGRNEF